MRMLPQEFKKNGYDYKLIRRNEGVVIYALFSNGYIHGYETHKVRISKPCKRKFTLPDGTINEITYEECEKLSSDAEFGKYGFSYQLLENAMKKFNELLIGESR